MRQCGPEVGRGLLRTENVRAGWFAVASGEVGTTVDGLRHGYDLTTLRGRSCKVVDLSSRVGRLAQHPTRSVTSHSRSTFQFLIDQVAEIVDAAGTRLLIRIPANPLYFLNHPKNLTPFWSPYFLPFPD